jgi:D-3-phosphoglycerate dehydrogenase
MSDLKNCRILVTPTSYGKHDPALRTSLETVVGEVIYNPYGRPLTSAEVRNLLPGIDGYIAGLDVIDRAALAAADRLKVIARYGVGVDQVDVEAAHERGIIVTNTPGANAVSVAELTIGVILAAARSIPLANETTHAGEWRRFSGVSLQGKTVGLLGFGAIGRQVALRLAPFGCRVLAYDPFVDAETAHVHHCELRPLDEIIAEADFLSLHLPVLPETRGLINAERLAQMKRGAYLINTARGELVDEAALFEALQSGQLAGAALDAFSVEPPGADHPLMLLPQVIATPHIGANTDGAASAMGWGALKDCLAVLRGEAPKHRVV